MIHAKLSGTLIEREYRELDRRLQRNALRPDLVFEPGLHPAEAVRAVGHIWRKRMGNEYESTTVFSAVAAQLVDASAPLDITAVMLRMAQDELRHTELCGRVAVALGVHASVDRQAIPVRLAQHATVSRREAALRNVLFTTCISEMFSVAYLTTSLERCEDPFLRHATRELLADEVLHGRFGFAYLEHLRRDIEAEPAMRDSLERYLRFAFAFAEQDFTQRRGMPRVSRDEARLGAVCDDEVGPLFRATMREAVVPAFQACGLAADACFDRRTLDVT
jgi:hypothetical protein